MHPALTPAMQASARFTYPVGMEGRVDLGGWLHTKMLYLSALTGPNTMVLPYQQTQYGTIERTNE